MLKERKLYEQSWQKNILSYCLGSYSPPLSESLNNSVPNAQQLTGMGILSGTLGHFGFRFFGQRDAFLLGEKLGISF